MAISPNPDRNEQLMIADHGTTCLITDIKADFYINRAKTKRSFPPTDRFSRPCGGREGFDDFVERWHE